MYTNDVDEVTGQGCVTINDLTARANEVLDSNFSTGLVLKELESIYPLVKFKAGRGGRTKSSAKGKMGSVRGTVLGITTRKFEDLEDFVLALCPTRHEFEEIVTSNFVLELPVDIPSMTSLEAEARLQYRGQEVTPDLAILPWNRLP